MLIRYFPALSLAAALVAFAPIASAQHDRDYRDYRHEHRDYRHDLHRERERERIVRERRHDYARQHDYRVYERAPRGYVVAAPVYVAPPVVYAPPAPSGINITFKKDPPIDSMAIMHLIQKNRHIRLAGNDKLRIEKSLVDVKERAQMVRDVLRSLGQPKTPSTTEATPA